jgi:acetolactate synthase-1/2/3 large subunit
LYFGKSGIYGERRSNTIVEECDLLISLGSRLSPLQIGHNIKNFATKSNIIIVDIDHLELKKFKKEKNIVPILSDIKNFLEVLKNEKVNISISNKWIKECNSLSKRYPLKEAQHISKNNIINSYDFINKLNKFTKINDIVCTDMGTALLTAYYNLKIKKNMRLLTSLALGEMGFGLPGAIGAAVCNLNKRIICLNCDGGMMFNLQELEVIKYHKLNIKIIVFSNDGYLMIKNTQKNLFNGRLIGTNAKTGVSCPNFSKISKAFGIPSLSVKKTDDIESKLKKFFSIEGPALIEVFMDKNQEFTPKLSSFKNEKGEFISPRFNQMSPMYE